MSELCKDCGELEYGPAGKVFGCDGPTKCWRSSHHPSSYDVTKIRKFASGATRDVDDTKHDYEGFLSPLVIERFGEYMTRNRKMKDRSTRDSDNWQKGIPLPAYMKSLLRHVIEAWKAHRGFSVKESLEDSLCAVLFNAQGYLYELLKTEKKSAITIYPKDSIKVGLDTLTLEEEAAWNDSQAHNLKDHEDRSTFWGV